MWRSRRRFWAARGSSGKAVWGGRELCRTLREMFRGLTPRVCARGAMGWKGDGCVAASKRPSLRVLFDGPGERRRRVGDGLVGGFPSQWTSAKRCCMGVQGHRSSAAAGKAGEWSMHIRGPITRNQFPSLRVESIKWEKNPNMGPMSVNMRQICAVLGGGKSGNDEVDHWIAALHRPRPRDRSGPELVLCNLYRIPRTEAQSWHSRQQGPLVVDKTLEPLYHFQVLTIEYRFQYSASFSIPMFNHGI